MFNANKPNGTLVLSRKTDQAIILRDEDGNEIGRIVVCGFNNQRTAAKIGLSLPSNIRIDREECVPQRV